LSVKKENAKDAVRKGHGIAQKLIVLFLCGLAYGAVIIVRTAAKML
jgi:hypothetical protein